MIKTFKRLTLRLFFPLIAFGLGCSGVRVVVAPTPSAITTVMVLAATPELQAHTPTLAPTDTRAPIPTQMSLSEPASLPNPPEGGDSAAVPPATPRPDTPIIVVEVNLNVRTGPGPIYDRIGLLTVGSTVEVIGRNEDGSWWQIVYPDSLDGAGWIANGYGIAYNTANVPLISDPSPPTPQRREVLSTPVPLIPTLQPTPPTVSVSPSPTLDFVIVKQRLWTNEENGGLSPNGSAATCGFGHEIHVTVIDAAGRPLDGVVIGDTYDNPRQITGSHGPGRTQYVLFGNGYNLFAAEDQSAGRSVTSETSHVLSAKDEEIPIPWLISAHYCASEAECIERASKNGLCRGHYSYDLVFQRAW